MPETPDFDARLRTIERDVARLRSMVMTNVALTLGVLGLLLFR
jgi:hypothetical protein